jgi:hypothetical protein
MMGLRARPPPDPTAVPFLNGRTGDICIGLTQQRKSQLRNYVKFAHAPVTVKTGGFAARFWRGSRRTQWGSPAFQRAPPRFKAAPRQVVNPDDEHKAPSGA